MLVLPHHTKIVIFQHHNLYGYVKLPHGGKLHHGHLERTVPADRHHLTLWSSQFCAHGRRNRISHGAHAAGGKKPSFLNDMISAGPDLILSHVRHIDRILLHSLGKLSDKSRRVYIVRIRSAHRLHGLPVRHKRLNPFPVIAYKLFRLHVFKNMSCVSHQRNGRPHILADFRRVYVNMHKHLVFRNQIRLVDRPVRHARSNHKQKVRLIHRPVGEGFSVVTHHTEIHRMFRGHRADSHHGGNHRNLMLLREGPKGVFRLTEKNAAPGADQRPFCPGKLF